MPNARFFPRLSPEVREVLTELLQKQGRSAPVSIAKVVHALGERDLHVEQAELTLKNSIAEFAIANGYAVSFDGT